MKRLLCFACSLLVAATMLSAAPLFVDGSTDETFNPGSHFNGGIVDLLVRPDGRIIVGGGFTTVPEAMRYHIAALYQNGSVDPGFVPGNAIADAGDVIALAPHQDRKLVVATHRTVLRLNADGSYDSSFASFQAYAIYAMTVQPDEKVLFAGEAFSDTNRTNFARLNRDGTYDNTFHSPQLGRPLALAVQTDAKILIGGDFATVDGVPRNGIARLNPDGTLDPTFLPPDSAARTNGYVKIILPQQDGKVIIAGDLNRSDETGMIVRLNSDGTLDSTFSSSAVPATTAAYKLSTMILQPDGKVLVGGWDGLFSTNAMLARLNADGTIDPTFTPLTGRGSISKIVVEESGTILVAGLLQQVAWKPFLLRLRSDGTLADFFPGNGPDGPVNSLALQDDGKIVIGGDFLGLLDNSFPKRVARLNPNGSLDPSFSPSAALDSKVMALALQRDGKIVVGAEFMRWGEFTQGGVVRLNRDGTLDQAFTPPGDPISGTISAIAVQPDGRILAGGQSFGLNNSTAYLMRSNTDLTPDPAFVASLTNFAAITSILLQPDGRIIIGSNAGMSISRLNPNGTVDSTFVADPAFKYQVRGVALQPDGKILAAGFFYHETEETARLIRLNSDGSRDRSFTPTLVGPNWIDAVTIQPGGKVLIGGFFFEVNGTRRNYVARLDTNGNLDPTFDCGEGAGALILGDGVASPTTLLLQPDGKLLLGGTFTSFSGVPRAFITRLLTGQAFSGPTISIETKAAAAILTWTAPSVSLQSASNALGPYEALPAATSPYTNALGASQQFFRLKQSP